MPRVQLARNVGDIAAAVDCSSKLFGTEPPQRRPGSANFATADPPLKLVLSEDADQAAGTVQERLAAQGLTTASEEQTSRCDAVPDKVWVNGPGGESWEVSTVLAAVEMPGGRLRSAARGDSVGCGTRTDPAGTATGPKACC